MQTLALRRPEKRLTLATFAAKVCLPIFERGVGMLPVQTSAAIYLLLWPMFEHYATFKHWLFISIAMADV